jgi:hypothetical protein
MQDQRCEPRRLIAALVLPAAPRTSLRGAKSATGNLHLDILRGGLGEEQGAFALGALMRWRRGRRKAGGEQVTVGRGDIVHPETEVMETWTMLGEPGVERVIGRERLHKLEMRVAEVELGEADGAAIHHLGADDGKSQPVAPELERGFSRRNGDGKVIQATESKRGTPRPGIGHLGSAVFGIGRGIHGELGIRL